MMRFIKNVALLLAMSLLVSSCATILNGRHQKVQINTDPGTEVLVNGEKPRTKKGMVLLERNLFPKQITVKREGFKDENVTVMQNKKSALYALSVIPFGVFFYPILFDNGKKAYNYQKEITISNDTELVTKKLDDAKNIQLEKVSADIPGEEMRYRRIFSYRRYLKKNDKIGSKPIGDGEGLNLENTIFANLLNDILKEQGYIDTTRRVLKSNYLTNLKVNAAAKKYTLHHIYTNFHSRFGGMIYVELSVDWDVLDFYGETIHSLNTSSTSGQFAYTYTDAKSDAMGSALKDAMEIGLISFMKDDKVQELLLDRGEENRETEFEAIPIPPSDNYVSDLGEAIKSSVTIKTEKGHGSGFVVSSSGHIITNYHVLADTTGLKVVGNDKKEYIPTIERVSKIHDLALLKIEANAYKPFRLDTSKEIEIAKDIYAVGTPRAEDLSQTISKGIISGVRDNGPDAKLIQTDASINSGNSGGAIVDKNGVVVGVVSSKLFGFGVEGVAFGIPAYEIGDRLKLNFE